jgi:hypothetical protein
MRRSSSGWSAIVLAISLAAAPTRASVPRQDVPLSVIDGRSAPDTADRAWLTLDLDVEVKSIR